MLKYLLVTCLLGVSLIASPVTISGPIYAPDGVTLANGSVVISNPNFTAADGRYVGGTSKTYTITNGVFSSNFEPSTNSSPVFSYTVIYKLGSSSPIPCSWTVGPSNASIPAVQTCPSAASSVPATNIALSQISIGGGANGACLAILNGVWSALCGTVLIYDSTPTTGTTSLTLQNGAGQNTNLLSAKNNAGTLLSAIGSGGDFSQYVSSVRKQVISGTTDGLSSDSVISWRSANSWDSGSIDLSIARVGIGLLEINNGVAGTQRDLLLRSPIWTATSTAALANSQCTLTFTSNTIVTLSCKGSDGTIRTTTFPIS